MLRTRTLKSFSDIHMNMRSKVGMRYLGWHRWTLSPLDVQLCTYSWGMPLHWYGVAAARGDFRGHHITQLVFTAVPHSVVPNHFWNHHCLCPAQNLSFPTMQQWRRNSSPSPHRWVPPYTFPTYRRILEGISKCLKTKKYWKGDLIMAMFCIKLPFIFNRN